MVPYRNRGRGYGYERGDEADYYGRGRGRGWYGNGGGGGWNRPIDPRHRSNYGPRNEPLPSMPTYAAGAAPRSRALPQKRRRGYERDENGVMRKNVKGGRIKKNKKPRDHEPTGNDLFCEVCERFLQDGASKASHDRGRDHLKKMEENREMEDDDKQPATTSIVKQERPSKETMERAMRAFQNMKSNPNVPRGFKDWIGRSLKEVAKKGIHLKNAVQREIVYTYGFFEDNGKLLSTTWDSMPLATGKCYVDENPTILPEIVFSGAQVNKLYEVAPVRKAPPKPPSPPRVVAVDMIPPPANESDSVAPLSDEITPAPAPVPLKKPKITWKLSRSAQTLLNYHESDRQKEILREFRARHSGISPPKPELTDEEKEESSTMQASVKLRNIKNMEEDQVPELRKLIGSIGNLGRAQNRVKQEALFILLCLLLESWEFEQAISTIRDLQATYRYANGTVESHSECAAHWVVSLLFQPAPTCHLDSELAEIPQILRKTPGFRYGLRLLRTVLHGEHTTFISQLFNSSVHQEFNSRTRYLLVPVLEILRMRAIIMIGRPSPATQSKVFQNSPVILSHVLNWLGYYDEGEILWEDANNHFERAGILIMPNKGCDPNNLNSDGSDRFVSFCNKPTSWRPDKIINSQLIFGFLNKSNCVLPYDDPVKDSVSV